MYGYDKFHQQESIFYIIMHRDEYIGYLGYLSLNLAAISNLFWKNEFMINFGTLFQLKQRGACWSFR